MIGIGIGLEHYHNITLAAAQPSGYDDMILGIIFFPNFSVLSIFIPAESLAGPDGEQPLHTSNSEDKRETKPCLISFSSSKFYTDIQCQVQLKKTALQYRITA